MTRSTVDAESVAVGTLARVAARRVLADADAEIVVFEFRAFVDVAARSIVGVQPEAGLASASVTAPDVQAHLLAESRCALTLVDVLQMQSQLRTIHASRIYLTIFYDIMAIYIASAGTVPPDVLEALFAQTLVRADGVLAMAVRTADAVTVDAALVDVDAIVVVGSNRVAGRANAVVPASPVLAGLTLAAFVRSLLTLVHVDAVFTRRVQGVARSADHSGRASAEFARY